ncbi:uncharacterized protein LOC122848563 [Aphidius gifuensis]|uniref:uncharacterized protein LOC122848563 n=1 Tax=Aphidius gifuensis TaxID=684658 RepID=UPI001CDB8336|nr:uncharacterized protein LOC122848563 [Aphidius gifuensis]
MEILKSTFLIINIFLIEVTAELITVDEKWVSPQKAYYCYSLREHNICTSLIHTRTGVPFDLGVSVGYDYHEYKSIKDTNLSPSMEFQFEYKKELTIKVLVVNEVVEAFNSTTHRLLLSTVIYDNYDGDTKIYKTKHKYYYYKDSASINKSLTGISIEHYILLTILIVVIIVLLFFCYCKRSHKPCNKKM